MRDSLHLICTVINTYITYVCKEEHRLFKMRIQILENVITTLVNNYLADHWHAVGEILGDSCEGHVPMFIAHVLCV